ncbi:hypothetical protein EDM80_09090 [bacterium]|nr:MAG: hypothetical protein EDM80_09090 [bacterium]
MRTSTYNAARLVYWYLRLNGFLQIENFIVHDDSSHLPRAEADMIGVRFSRRKELDMEDDVHVVSNGSFAQVVIAEVKKGLCSINRAWRDPDRQIVQRVLRAIGCFGEDDLENAAQALYKNGCFQTEAVSLQWAAFGDRKSDNLPKEVRQITFDEALDFLFNRFRSYHKQKSSLAPYWPEDGQCLASLARDAKDLPEFCGKCRPRFGLPVR